MADTKRALTILWAAMLVSCLLFLFILRLLPAGEADAPIFPVLAAIAIVNVAASFPVRRRVQARSDEAATMQGLVIALVLCESAAILGIVAHVTSGHPYSQYLVVAALVGEVLHYPGATSQIRA